MTPHIEGDTVRCRACGWTYDLAADATVADAQAQLEAHWADDCPGGDDP
jgi:rubredoxin